MTLQNIIDNSDNIVFFGGAGVSTESGIPDFRSVDGLYNQTYKYPPEVMLSHSFFVSNTSEFFKFYRDKMIYRGAKPNAAHLKLAELERTGKVKAVITQNIDGLHSDAGSKTVIELHGSVHRNHCAKCGKFHSLDFVMQSADIPKCECGGVVKPDVVLYDEPLDDAVVTRTVNAITACDCLIVGGTSLAVYPAAGFLDYYTGDRLVLINKSKTNYDSLAALIINDNIGKVLGEIK